MAELRSYSHTSYDLEGFEVVEMNTFIGSNSESTPLIGSRQENGTFPEAQVHPKEEPELPTKDYESLDYDVCYNVPYKSLVRGYQRRTYIQIQVMRWVLCGIIGFCTGIVAFFIDICVQNLFRLKYSMFDKVYHSTIDSGNVFAALLVLVGFNVLFAIIASLLVTVEPVAAGSGIPEIKCYLNGVKVPHVTRVTTLITKAVGVLFSVAGGFFVGKEGPMIHSGAIIGAGIPQFRSMFLKWINFPYRYFRSDRDKRDFVSSGAAAGVAAAFGAPIGGVLFSLEEGSSFWNQSLTWRTLFCSFCSTFALNLFLSAYSGSHFGVLAAPSLVDFGTFSKDASRLWNAYHLIIFVIMGAVGGLLGALFNSLNTRVTVYRIKFLHRRSRAFRVAEAVLIIMVTTLTLFLAAMLLGTCVATDANAQPDQCSYEDQSFRNETKDYFCPHYGQTRQTVYYNDMGTLLFNSQETAIKQLFHQNGAFTLPTLGIVFMIYFFIACWTYGAGIPSGLFIPCLLVGAIYGRFVATLFKHMSESSHYLHFLNNLYPGTYALIGAASFLGGVVRMTISLTVILIESTNEIDYGLPIMLTLMVAKWVGDIFNEGLYDIHVEVKQTPLLGWESPHRMEKLTAEDVMNSKLRYMYPITRVRSVVQLLRTTAHSAFLIVTPVDIDTIPERPTNVSTKHTPQLYSRESFLGETDPDSDSEKPVYPARAPPRVLPSEASPYSVNQAHRRTRVRSPTSPLYPSLYAVPESNQVGLAMSFTLPEHSRGQGIMRYTDEGEPKKEKLLIFHGIILRSQLIVLLKNGIFFEETEGSESQPDISHDDLVGDYPRYPSVYEANLSEAEQNKLMDLSLFMNPSPYTISNQAPLPQVFNLFRTMGLRHLPVLRDSGIVVGVITRHDLTHEKLLKLRLSKKRERLAQRRMSRVHASSSIGPNPGSES